MPLGVELESTHLPGARTWTPYTDNHNQKNADGQLRTADVGSLRAATFSFGQDGSGRSSGAVKRTSRPSSPTRTPVAAVGFHRVRARDIVGPTGRVSQGLISAPDVITSRVNVYSDEKKVNQNHYHDAHNRQAPQAAFTVPATAQQPWCVLWSRTQNKGHPLTQPCYRISRARGSVGVLPQLVLPDPSISVDHATIGIHRGGSTALRLAEMAGSSGADTTRQSVAVDDDDIVYMIDHDSHNGTFVNNKCVRDNSVQVKDGDLIRFGYGDWLTVVLNQAQNAEEEPQPQPQQPQQQQDIAAPAAVMGATVANGGGSPGFAPFLGPPRTEDREKPHQHDESPFDLGLGLPGSPLSARLHVLSRPSTSRAHRPYSEVGSFSQSPVYRHGTAGRSRSMRQSAVRHTDAQPFAAFEHSADSFPGFFPATGSGSTAGHSRSVSASFPPDAAATAAALGLGKRGKPPVFPAPVRIDIPAHGLSQWEKEQLLLSNPPEREPEPEPETVLASSAEDDRGNVSAVASDNDDRRSGSQDDVWGMSDRQSDNGDMPAVPDDANDVVDQSSDTAVDQKEEEEVPAQVEHAHGTNEVPQEDATDADEERQSGDIMGAVGPAVSKVLVKDGQYGSQSARRPNARFSEDSLDNIGGSVHSLDPHAQQVDSFVDDSGAPDAESAPSSLDVAAAAPDAADTPATTIMINEAKGYHFDVQADGNDVSSPSSGYTWGVRETSRSSLQRETSVSQHDDDKGPEEQPVVSDTKDGTPADRTDSVNAVSGSAKQAPVTQEEMTSLPGHRDSDEPERVPHTNMGAMSKTSRDVLLDEVSQRLAEVERKLQEALGQLPQQQQAQTDGTSFSHISNPDAGPSSASSSSAPAVSAAQHHNIQHNLSSDDASRILVASVGDYARKYQTVQKQIRAMEQVVKGFSVDASGLSAHQHVTARPPLPRPAKAFTTKEEAAQFLVSSIAVYSHKIQAGQMRLQHLQTLVDQLVETRGGQSRQLPHQQYDQGAGHADTGLQRRRRRRRRRQHG